MAPATLTRVPRVTAALRDHDWAWARENRPRIDAHWAARRAARPAMFNGRVLMMSGQALADGTLHAWLFETDYAVLTAFKDLGFPDPSVSNAFAAAVPRTADGAYLLGVMNRHTASAGQVYFPCGTPDHADVAPDGTVDLAASALRELREETGLVATGAPDAGWVVVRDGGLTAFLKPVALPDDAATVLARVDAHLAAEAEPELAGILTVRGPRDIDPARMPGFVQAYLRAAFA
ncbi:hypothetical protein OPKNFCMD_4305 [Methylobacterium crusticola]|uniref:NUDIX hydrolase n=1 Tax=Methylobacterium crusticola TaxID=1697972 RepID=A0ABQ4R3L1_9HYPH|nr:NUDIX hydrolase [Methylobacterium crusticola]GJD51550.1 hypothetical protein OPKNFCMD_4305 [Methylobacterium crusticola]